MQRTEKYFEQDAFRTGCESVILAAEPDEKTGGGRIALDEDEMARYLARNTAACPFFEPGDEYKIVSKQN